MTRRRATALGIVALALLARPHSVSALWMLDGTPLVRSAGDQVQPAMVSDGVGGAIVVWSDSRREETSFDIYAQRVTVRGTPRWRANGVPVCGAAGDQFRPVGVSDGVGGAIIAWVDTRKGDGSVVDSAFFDVEALPAPLAIAFATGCGLWASRGCPTSVRKV